MIVATTIPVSRSGFLKEEEIKDWRRLTTRYSLTGQTALLNFRTEFGRLKISSASTRSLSSAIHIMMKTFWAQPLLKQIGTTALASFIIHSAIVLVHLYVVSPFGFGGTFLLQFFMIFFSLLMGLIFLAMLVSIFLLLFRKFRRHAVTILVCGLIYVSIGIALIRLSGPVRMNGFQRLAIQSQPLIKAIEQFVADEGHPPSTLQDLVPKYFSKIPKTGMPAYPNYNYSTEASRWKGNPWVLYINCTSGGINLDKFIYFPKQNYPDKGYGGSLERVGKWAYVHE